MLNELYWLKVRSKYISYSAIIAKRGYTDIKLTNGCTVPTCYISTGIAYKGKLYFYTQDNLKEYIRSTHYQYELNALCTLFNGCTAFLVDKSERHLSGRSIDTHIKMMQQVCDLFPKDSDSYIICSKKVADYTERLRKAG